MPPTANAVPVLGPTIITILISEVLFGVLTTQTYEYFQKFPRDRPWLKFMVLFLWLLDCVNALLLGVSVYQSAVSDFGNIDDLGEFPRALDVAFCLSIFIDLISQFFYAHRLWRISGKNWMPCVSIFLALTKAIPGFVSSYALGVIRDMAVFTKRWNWPVNLTLSAATAGDLFTAVSLSYILWSKREVSFSQSTLAILEKLIKWTVQTGVLISMTTISINICFITMKGNFIWVGLHLLLPRIYSNSVLACLNGRAILHNIDSEGNGVLTYSTGSTNLASDKPPSRVMFHPMGSGRSPKGVTLDLGSTKTSATFESIQMGRSTPDPFSIHVHRTFETDAV